MSDPRPRVLVVDDSSAMRGFVTALLESDGQYEVEEATSGFDALRALPRSQFALIITDINMPDINGLELVRFVRDSDRHRSTPLILISTDGREADRERGLKLGADAYVTKPFSGEQLLAAAQKAMAARRP